MNAQKLSQIRTDLDNSIDFLESALNQEKNAYMIAAVIQSFEICFELSWKYMQCRLSTEDGVTTASPKSAIRAYAAAGRTTEPEKWLEFADLRNLSVHTYRQALADEMYVRIKDSFLPLSKNI
jgi:nucleotidyltransferase substrate binding protein (TIGR01987 family)